MRNHIRRRQRTHTHFDRLVSWNPQGHFVFFKSHDEKFQGHARNFLFVNPNNFADTMGRIHNKFVNAEIKFLFSHVLPFAPKQTPTLSKEPALKSV